MNRLYDRQEKGLVVSKMRLWKASAATKLEDIAEIEKKVKNYTHVKFDGVLLNNKSDVQKSNIYVEELPLAQADEDMVVIELPKLKDTFVLVPQSGGNEQGEESKNGSASSNNSTFIPEPELLPG